MGARSNLDRLQIVLVSTRNPLNIGAAARAMSNFGCPNLRLVTPYDPSFREARSAIGASAILEKAEVHPTVASAIADCSLVVGTTAVGHRELQHPLHLLDSASKLLRQRLSKGKVAILFGSEKWGLSNDALSHCHWLLHIPTRHEHYSMNLGQAVAVCLYELSRGKNTSVPPAKPRFADMETVDRITAALLQALHTARYIAPRGEAKAEEKLRRMIRRLRLGAADAEVLLGMLHKILRKLGAKG